MYVNILASHLHLDLPIWISSIYTFTLHSCKSCINILSSYPWLYFSAGSSPGIYELKFYILSLFPPVDVLRCTELFGGMMGIIILSYLNLFIHITSIFWPFVFHSTEFEFEFSLYRQQVYLWNWNKFFHCILSAYIMFRNSKSRMPSS